MTPGPWLIASDGCKVYIEPNGIKPNSCHSVAQLFGPDADANARLIAAAPDLLDLAHNVGGLDDHVVTYGDIRTLRDLIIEWRDAARDAIAKAEGDRSYDCDNFGECDCCGERRPLSQSWHTGMETWTCDECLGRDTV